MSNLSFAMRAIGTSTRELRRRIPYVLELVGLEKKADQYPGGAVRRRAAAGGHRRALVNNPSMIIADEPTGNLDPQRSLEIMICWSASTSWVPLCWWSPTRNPWSTGSPNESSPSRTDGSSATRQAGITTMARRFNGKYYLSEGFHSIFTHGFMSFAAVCMIVACLLIMGSFTLLAVNLDHMLGDLEDENLFLAYIDDSYSEEQARALQPKIEAVPNVSQVTFVTRAEALEDFKAGREQNDLMDSLPPEVLRDRFEIHVKDIEQMAATVSQVEAVRGVAHTQAAIEIAQGFVMVRNIATGVAAVLVAMLVVVSLFIIANTIKLATFYRREEIAIMKMCGATNGFIRWPFVVEGMILGLTGALVAFFIQWGLYEAVSRLILQTNGLSLITVLSYASMAGNIVLVFCGVGLVIGVGGSVVAIRKFLQV